MAKNMFNKIFNYCIICFLVSLALSLFFWWVIPIELLAKTAGIITLVSLIGIILYWLFRAGYIGKW